MHSKRIDRLFLSFTAFYGPLWRSQFKDAGFLEYMKKEWMDALSLFADKDLDDAVHYYRQNKEFPPTLPHFVTCCQQMKRKNTAFHREPATGTSTREVAIHHLNQMKTFLR